MIAAYTFFDVMMSMIVFFAWFMFVAWVVMLLFDNFRRHDHGGWAKAGWAILLIFLPLIGAISYVVARPSSADVTLYGLEDQPGATYVPTDSRSAAAEIARLNDLRAEGAISDAEYEELKRRTITAV